jgi:hypothetical protein
MPNAIHEFTLLTSASDVEELPLDAIHEACDDAAPMSSSGIAYVGFSRLDSSRDNAIAGAVRDLTAVLIRSGSSSRVVGVAGPDYDPCRYPERASAPTEVA